MSLTRTVLVCIQALCYHIALTPPNPTPSKARYHTEQVSVLQIATLIFLLQKYVFWLCSLAEVLYYVQSKQLLRLPPSVASFLFSSQPNIELTPLFVIGVFAVMLGTYIRLDCFRALGRLFTFDLTILPNHKLITDRFYAYVRHPAYTGSMLLIIGLTLSHLTPGSWLTERCIPHFGAFVVATLWWAWTWSVGISRADAEDKEMKKLFNGEWDAYAARVPWWFFPGLY